jgi:flagellar export protein FliJ
LSKDIEDQAMHVHKTVKLADQKRHELISVMQKRKTLKKLKYKEQQAYQQKLMQDERKLMDEIASIRHGRKV